MLFSSPLYGVFLAAAYGVFWALRAQRQGRILFLVVASYVFYFYGTYETATAEAAATGEAPLFGPGVGGAMAWSTLCLGIVFVGSTLDFFIGRALGKAEDGRKRKALLLVSVVYYLGVLALFKYFNFAADSLAELARVVGLPMEPWHLRLALPFGISFFTFETMSYTIDVYRRDIEPCERYLDYLAFVAFFPHLVAGPIVRPHAMLPQLAKAPRFDEAAQASGLFLIATGLFKKMVIGDTLASSLVNRAFASPERFSSLEMLVAVYAYAFQIYADFSGYTDVARGSARLFGYELPVNFDRPYTATDLQDFWHRWHISLSTWLRDYLYIPLGGSRSGPWKTYRNLAITMVLGGLWHGASWNFVIWGALHGGALAVTRMWQRARASSRDDRGGRVRNGAASESSPWRRPLLVVATFHFVCLAWVFFRAPTFEHARLTLARIVAGSWSAHNLSPKLLGVLALAAVLHFTPRAWVERATTWFSARSAWAQGALLAAVLYVLHFAAAAKPEPFIYGQF